MSGLNQHTANVPIPKKVQPFESVTLLLKLYNMLTKEKCLELGFKELSHFTVGNSLTYLINRDKYLNQMAKKFNQPTVEDLIATIGYGGIVASQVVSKIRDLYEKEVKKVKKEGINDIEKHNIIDTEHKKKRKKNNNQGIVVKGLDNILIRFAKCCNPLPGDEIIGYITKGRGVAVHRADCPNANVNGDFFKNRLVDVAWKNVENNTFEAEIQIKSNDRRGIINDITHIVVVEKISLNGISARKGKDNIVNVNLLVEVNNIDELNLLMKKIKSIPGVENIYRVVN